MHSTSHMWAPPVRAITRCGPLAARHLTRSPINSSAPHPRFLIKTNALSYRFYKTELKRKKTPPSYRYTEGKRREKMDGRDQAPAHHVDTSRPVIAFPLGMALLIVVVFGLSGIFSCCYHWDKIRSLSRHLSADAETVTENGTVSYAPSIPNPGDVVLFWPFTIKILE